MQHGLCKWTVMLLLACGTTAAASAYRYGQTPPDGVGGAIELNDMHGKHFTLQGLHGKPALLFFGFAGCGSTCPIALATARQTLANFADDAPPVLFVTLDPLGDTPARLRQYLNAFDRRIIGLTGEQQQIAVVLDRYGVATQTQTNGLGHSAMWYLIGRSGRVERVYRYNTPAAELVADLRAARSDARSAP